MPLLTSLRLLGLATTVVLLASVPDLRTYNTAVISLGMAHYLISFVYARRQLGYLARTRETVFPLLIVLGLGFAIMAADYSNTFKLILYFGFHHVFNEVYIAKRALGLREGADARFFRLSASLFHAFIYLGILVNEDFLSWQAPVWPSSSALLGGLVLSGVLFGLGLYRIRDQLTRRRWIDACGFELGGAALAVAAISGYAYIHFLDVVLYHFVFWAFFPAAKLLRGGWSALARYAALNVGLTGALVVTAFYLSMIPGSGLWIAFYVLSYVHITASLALSTAHPAWITRWFHARAAPAPAAT